MVKVKLMEKSVNSHVGNVMVAKVIIQYRTLGTVWKMKLNTHPIHPAIVEGLGGNGVRGEAAIALEASIGEVEGAVRLRARDGARPTMTKTRLEVLRFVSKAQTTQKGPTRGATLQLVQRHRKRADSFTGGWMNTCMHMGYG
jgi:hypothetical protein